MVQICPTWLPNLIMVDTCAGFHHPSDILVLVHNIFFHSVFGEKISATCPRVPLAKRFGVEGGGGGLRRWFGHPIIASFEMSITCTARLDVRSTVPRTHRPRTGPVTKEKNACKIVIDDEISGKDEANID